MKTGGKRVQHRSFRLDDICMSITDGKHGDCRNEAGSGFYFLSCKDVFGGHLNYATAREITQSDFVATHQRTRLEPSDVLVTNSGTIGRMAIAPDNEATRRTTFQKSVAILKPLTSYVEPRYLFYRLNLDLPRLIDIAGGTAQKNLLLRDLRSFIVDIPPLPTQRKIAAILSAYDDLIENNNRRIKLLEEMARRIYHEWFVDFRYPGNENIPLVDSELGPIPEGWVVTSLEAACVSIERGVTPSYQPGSGRYIVNQKCNRGQELDASNLKELAAHLVVPSSKIARVGDVLINCLGEGTIGRVHLFRTRGVEWAVDQHMSICRPPQFAIGELIYQYLSSVDGQDEIASLKTGGTNMTVLNVSKLRAIKLLVPSTELLVTFENRMRPIREYQALNERRAANLRVSRDLLLPRLVSGEIDVTDLDIAMPAAAA